MHKIDLSALRKRVLIAASRIAEIAYRRGYYHGVKASCQNINVTDCRNFIDKTYRHIYHAPKYVQNSPDGKYGKTVFEKMDISIEDFHIPLGSEFLFELGKYEEAFEKETIKNEYNTRRIYKKDI
jgi:hypothetical protein